ncbi:hypothetical protein A5768_28690 [Mycolicibacterium fortuitum]|nr:hypothetical protein A5768_28690 [Mycolicibacterium fortuitum]
MAGHGSANGFRYRDTLSALDVPEIEESFADALTGIEHAAGGIDSDLGDWSGHAPALSAYAMWAVYALMAHNVIDAAETRCRLGHLAALQRTPGIRSERGLGWLAPPWWGSTIHVRHQHLLVAKNPVRYTAATFSCGLFMETNSEVTAI